jgi:anti-sigma B factor antagonist
MKTASVRRDGVTVISFLDNLDATTAAEAAALLEAKIEGGHTNLVFDMGGLTFLSSAGLRVILGAMQKARTAGGDVRLAGAEGNIRRVVEMAGVARIMKAFPSVDQAAASFSC